MQSRRLKTMGVMVRGLGIALRLLALYTTTTFRLAVWKRVNRLKFRLHTRELPKPLAASLAREYNEAISRLRVPRPSITRMEAPTGTPKLPAQSRRWGKPGIHVIAPFLAGAREKRIQLSEETQGPVRLVVIAYDSMVEVAGGDEIVVRVEGRGGSASLARDPGDPGLVKLRARGAHLHVTAPLEAIVVKADSSQVRVEAPSPLRYIAVGADSSQVEASASIARGGGVLLRLDSSNLSIHLRPQGPGEYWLEVEADSSNILIHVEGEKKVEVVEKELDASRLKLPGKEKDGVHVEARIRADSSRIRIT